MDSIKSGMKEFFKATRELLFPPACLSCSSSLEQETDLFFCPACLDDITLIRGPLCSCCGQRFPAAAGSDHLCGACLSKRRHFSRARALVAYSETMAKAIFGFKYGGKTTALSTFTALKKKSPLPEQMLQPDLIIPVPLHSGRLRQRGFNQAILLARAFFPGQANLIHVNLLERHRWTTPQTKLNGLIRRRNVKGAFRLKQPAQVCGKNIILVDDVYTTGATVDECARILHKAGALEVQVLTLARTE